MDIDYSKVDKCIKAILKYKKSGEVLDIGVGNGRNALFLSSKGFKVIGIDSDKEMVRKFKQNADKLGLKVIGKQADIEKYNIGKKFEIIISTNVLHFLDKRDIKRVIGNIKQHTKKDGINALIVFTEENPDKNYPYLFKKGELKKYYSDWDIKGYKELITPLETHQGKMKPHRHGIAILLAIKNKN